MTEETLRPLYYAVTHFDAKTNEVATESQAKICDVDLSRFVETDILKTVLCEDLNYEATKDTICSLAYGNDVFSTHAANVLVELVLRRQIESTMQTNKQSQDLDILPHLFVTLSALIAVKDSLRRNRIERIMPQLIKVFKFNMKSSSQADYAMRWLLAEAHSLEEIREWLLGHLDAWLADLLIASPFDSVRRCAEEMVRVVVANKSSTNTDIILKPLLELLPICAKHAGPAADKVIARKANSPKTKSWKLASFFRLLKTYTKTKEQKIQCTNNWSRLRKLLKLIIDEEKDNDLELNQNKYTLCDLLLHLVSDCPANLYTICDDIEAMSRVLDCFINLRGLPETVAYNESMIPLGYKLVTLCVKRNPPFIPQVLLPNHHTFEWSILKFCQSTKYPKSSQALFAFLQLVVEHPDMDSWRQRRIKAALVDDNDNPFSHNPLRLLTLFDALIRTERDGQVFCDNDGLNILHRFMQQFKENPGVDPDQETLVCNLAALVISKAQRGDLRLKKEKEARATRAREELLALLDEEEDTAKRKKQRAKRKKNRQKRQRQQKAARQAVDIDDPKTNSGTSDQSAPSSTTSNTSNSLSAARSSETSTNNKSNKPPPSANSSSSSSRPSAAVGSHSSAIHSIIEDERSSDDLMEEAKRSSFSYSSSTIPSDSRYSSHHRQKQNQTSSSLLHQNQWVSAKATTATDGAPSSNSVVGENTRPFPFPGDTPHGSSFHYNTNRPLPSQLQQHNQQDPSSVVNTQNLHDISPTSNRNSNANHRRRGDLDMAATTTHSAISRPSVATGTNTTTFPASFSSSTPEAMSSATPRANPNISHPSSGASSACSSVPVSPVHSARVTNAVPPAGGDVPVPVKPPTMDLGLNPNTSNSSANGWHTVTNAQHKSLQKENKKLGQKNKELQKDLRKLEQKNKRLLEFLDLSKDEQAECSSQLEIECSSKQQALEDLRVLTEKFDDLKVNYENSVHSVTVLESELQEHQRRQQELKTPAAAAEDLEDQEEQDRFAYLSSHTEQELQSLTDEALDDLEQAIENAKRQLFHEKENLEIAGERVGKSKRDRLCLICTERSRAIMFLPCRHKHVCDICAPRIALCPACGKKIEERVTSERSTVNASLSSSAGLID